MKRILVLLAVLTFTLPAMAASQVPGYWMPDLVYGQSWPPEVTKNVCLYADRLNAEITKITDGSATANKIVGSIAKLQYGVWCESPDHPGKYAWVGLKRTLRDMKKPGPFVRIGFCGAAVKKLSRAPQYVSWEPYNQALIVPGEMMITRAPIAADVPPIVAGARFQALEVIRGIALASDPDSATTARGQLRAFELWQRVVDQTTHRSYGRAVRTLARKMVWDPPDNLNIALAQGDLGAIDKGGNLLPTPISAIGFSFNAYLSVGMAAITWHSATNRMLPEREQLYLDLEKLFRDKM